LAPGSDWQLRDYVSPGLVAVHPDDAFPHMRPGDPLHHPWKYLRRDVPHIWYCDERFPLMGFLNRDEATLLHNIALQFAGRRALEIGSWLGWSTCHLALAGVALDSIDPTHDDPSLRASIEDSLVRAGVRERVNLAGGRSPETIAQLGRKWSLFFIDGNHEAPGPVRDALACLPYATDDCAFVFHDLASPAVAAGLRVLEEHGFHVVVYQTAQVMAMAWRGNVTPVAHVPDPNVAWQLPPHLAGLPISGVDFKPPARSSYRQLRDVAYDGERARPSVCIVTNELIGPFKNGGVGTAMTGLAETLAADGLPVTILYTGTIWSPDISLGKWRTHYAARGITLEAVTIDAMSSLAGPMKDQGFGSPWLVFQWLAERQFDVIHFNDCAGEGSLAIAAKKLGLAFAESLLVVALHSPSRWVLELNETLPSGLLLAAFDYAERVSIAGADVLWSPSRYLLDWIAARDFELPPQTFVQQYAIPSVGGETTSSTNIRELVFFGRLEERKGLRLFCNAIHLLRDELAQQNITVTFLGKPGICDGEPSLHFIARRSPEWRFPLRMLTELDQPEALRYLREGGRLAVMPSPVDNSPCTVYEALKCGIPFLAARTGGIPELIADEDRERVLFENDVESLCKAIRNAIANGGGAAKAAVPQTESRRSFIDMHAHWRSFLPARKTRSDEQPTVAAIIEHRAGDRLDLTLASLGEYPKTWRFVVLNRSGRELPLKNIDLLTQDVDAIEEELAAITEDHVLFIHSGVTVDVAKFATMLEALAASGVDGLMPASRRVTQRGTRTIPTLGGSAPFSLYEGVTYAGAMLMRRDAFVEAKRGRELDIQAPFLAFADFCITGAKRVWPYPDVVQDQTHQANADIAKALPSRVAAYENTSPNDRYYMLASAYRAGGKPLRTKRDLALAAVDLGFAPLVRIGSGALRRLRRWRSR